MLEYLNNGGNGTGAYLAIHPNVMPESAATLAWRLLRKVEVLKALNDARNERMKRLEMDGDEAIGLLSLAARADIGDAFDAEGKLLPITRWPESLRLAVRSIKPGPFGDAITLHDGLKARELMAIAQGRLKQQHLHKHEHSLAAILAGEDEEASA